jgi:Xaa-Pro aminopeptidase
MVPDFPTRIKSLRSLMEKEGLDACLLNSRNDIFYYTGQSIGDSCYLLVPQGPKPTLFVTSLSNQVKGKKGCNAVFIKGVHDISRRLKPFRRVGFDEYTTSFWAFSELRKSKSVLKPFASSMKEPRMVKDGFEMEKIKKAAGIASQALSGLGDITGKAESDVSWHVESFFRESGAKPSFETIVASGKNSAFVHHTSTGKAISGKDLVIIDCGAMLHGYCSDMTRTFCRSPGPKERKIMENISEIQADLIGMVSDGVRYDDIQKRYESLLSKKGYRVMHSFGHGIGTGVHERPSKGDVLKEGMVITVEPGAYIKSFGGCRIEDMVLVRKGKAKILT